MDYLGSDGVILPQGYQDPTPTHSLTISFSSRCELPLTTQSEETEEEEWSEDDHQPEQSDPLPDHQSDVCVCVFKVEVLFSSFFSASFFS